LVNDATDIVAAKNSRFYFKLNGRRVALLTISVTVVRAVLQMRRPIAFWIWSE
jgi:hypothetical protein